MAEREPDLVLRHEDQGPWLALSSPGRLSVHVTMAHLRERLDDMGYALVRDGQPCADDPVPVCDKCHQLITLDAEGDWVHLAACSACGGRRWTDDENWSPDYPATFDGTRSPGDGLIPCGSCNLGGWDVPLVDVAPTSVGGTDG